MIAAILLAAGQARRFGAQKLLQDLDARPLIRWSAEQLTHDPIAELVVVVPPDHQAMLTALDGLSARFVVNPDPSSGMASSLVSGVQSLGDRIGAAVIALADTPLLRREVLERVVARYRAGGAPIVAPMYRGVPGHPVLFDRSVFGELLSLTGDSGARAVVERDPGRVAVLALEESRPIDVDTPADLARLRDRGQRR